MQQLITLVTNGITNRNGYYQAAKGPGPKEGSIAQMVNILAFGPRFDS